MKVTEFLSQERERLTETTKQARADAPDAYTGMTKAFPYACRAEFLDWLERRGLVVGGGLRLADSRAGRQFLAGVEALIDTGGPGR